ncbi:MAG: alpha-2-macroglobulin family protein, partial [Sphingomonadales bacterium]|nr:alpha-2-macroglobulin family protein [Sphingomonadales bacterium]
AADPGAVTRAAERAAALDFLEARDFTAAYDLAAAIGRRHMVDGAAPEQVATALAEARATGQSDRALRLAGAMVALDDAAGDWAAYADLLRTRDYPQRTEAVAAAVNAVLRAGPAPVQAEALATLARVLEANDRYRPMISALRLAQGLSPREDIAAALTDALGKYGFRVTGDQVEADGAAPRICAQFSEPLARSGVDYASFVQLPEPGLSVEAEGDRLCVAGIAHGKRYQVTFRAGLPAASGEVTGKDVTVTSYIRDRAPAVRFPGRAYILPKAADAGLPVETVNTAHLDLALYRISDRNLVAAMRDDYFARSLDYWQAEYFTDQLAEKVWTGSADVGMQVNRDMTTRLPVQEVTGALGPGIYALQARIPGTEPYDNPPATQWFVISDLGLASYSGADGLAVVVRGLSDAAPRAGVAVELINRANAVIGTATTDAEGVARFEAGLAAGRGAAAPALISVAQGEDMAFLSLTEPEFDLSDRGVEGLPPAPPIDVFLATDRGAYRVGETVHATLLARDSTARALPGLPLTAVLIRPDGVEYARQIAPEAGAGGATAAFDIGAQAPRGTWRLDVLADPKAPPLASAKLLVEDFLPERIDFDLNLPDGILAATDLPQIEIAARYLFGAKGAGLQTEGEVRLSAAAELPGFAGYRFGRYDQPFDPMTDSLPGAETDDQGRASLTAALPDPGEGGARPLSAQFNLRVKEGSGRPVERTATRLVLPADPVIGIKPMFEGDLPENSDARFSLIALGPDAQPTAAKAHWVLNRVETRYQWYALDGYWDWEAVTRRTRVAEGDVTLGAEPIEVGAPVAWGQYELVAEIEGQVTEAAISFDAGWYAPAGVIASPDKLPLSLDKPAYRAGETAELRLVAPAAGVAQVSVLSNRLIALKAVEVQAGENVISLPVTDDWGAGAYVTASVIRPLAAAAPDHAPTRALGLAHAAVDPGDRQLRAVFEVAPEADPRGPLPVAVKLEGVAPGDEAFVTIAAVDLGILNLTGFKSPDPSAHYFGQRRLGVGLRDVYGRLIDGQAGDPGAIRSGGDAAREMTMQAPPPTEELVAYVSGPLKVDADGYARTSFDLPSFNGTVRLMAVAWSGKGVGQASADVLVRDPVVMTATVPRFMAPGDRSRLMLELHHASGPSGRMGLDVTSGGMSLSDVPAGVDLAEGGKVTLTLPMTAPMAEGVHQIRIALSTPAGRVLEKNLTLRVERLDPAIARQSRFDLAAGETFTFDANVFAGLVPGSARATLAAGPIARFDTAGLLQSLDAYPYGCTEQTTSKALPLLYLSSVAEAMGLVTPANLDERIEGAIARVLTNQDASGGFGLWSPSSSDLWLDAYVTDFLSRAKALGHAVPEAAFRMALDNLRNGVNYSADFDAESNGGGAALAYALMVLAREGAAAISDLRYYADVKGDDFATPLARAQIGAALAMYGDQTRADAMFARAARVLTGEDGREWRVDYGSALRDRAGVLALAAEAGSTAVPLDDLGASVAERMSARYLSTQEAVWTLLAANALIDRPGTEGLSVNGAPATGPLVRVLDAETAGASLAIRNDSARAQVLTLTTLGVPEVAEPAGGKGYAIARRYYDLTGKPLDPARVAQGTRMVAVLEVTPFEDTRARLMVNDPLPAGFEIDNPHLLQGGDVAALDWLEVEGNTQMVEFREDAFRAALDYEGTRPFRLAYLLRAVSPGTFHQPAASVEDMYRPDYRAQTDAGRVVID